MALPLWLSSAPPSKGQPAGQGQCLLFSPPVIGCSVLHCWQPATRASAIPLQNNSQWEIAQGYNNQTGIANPFGRGDNSSYSDSLCLLLLEETNVPSEKVFKLKGHITATLELHTNNVFAILNCFESNNIGLEAYPAFLHVNMVIRHSEYKQIKLNSRVHLPITLLKNTATND